MRQTGMARTDDSIHKQRPAAVKEQTTPKQPEGRPARPEPQEATTTLPRVGRSPQPGASNGGEPALRRARSSAAAYAVRLRMISATSPTSTSPSRVSQNHLNLEADGRWIFSAP